MKHARETRGGALRPTPQQPPPRGIEPLSANAQGVEEQALTEDAESVLALRLALLVQNDPELAGVLTAGPDLPQAVKAGISAMVKASKP